jgi:hypothetical protein
LGISIIRMKTIVVAALNKGRGDLV